MSDSDEAFSNAEQLFRQAFTAMDPVPILLQLLKEYPTYGDLASLASAIARLCNSSNAPTFETETLPFLISRELADMHFKVYRTDDVKKYGQGKHTVAEFEFHAVSNSC